MIDGEQFTRRHRQQDNVDGHEERRQEKKNVRDLEVQQDRENNLFHRDPGALLETSYCPHHRSTNTGYREGSEEEEVTMDLEFFPRGPAFNGALKLLFTF